VRGMAEGPGGEEGGRRGIRGNWRVPMEFMRTRFLVGLGFLAQFIITWIVLDFLIDFLRDVTQPAFVDFFGRNIPGLGFVILIGVPMIFGALALHFVGVRAMATLEATAVRVPLIGAIFTVSHQIVSAMGGGGQSGFRKVVTIEYPRKGIWSLGFLTRVITLGTDEKIALVYIPTAPTPNSGNMLLVPISEVMETDMSVNELMRTVLSAGVSSPAFINRRPLSLTSEGEIEGVIAE